GSWMATAGPSKKSVANSGLRANGSDRSKPRPFVRCDTRPVSGSWKVSSKPRKRKSAARLRFARNFHRPPEFNPRLMKRDDDQELWDLLGQAPESKVSPFFARNVLREIREPSDWATLRGWLNPRRLVPAL